jgi:hypothetical protein
MKLLVVTAEPIDARLLRSAVGDGVEDAEVTGESEPAVAVRDALETFPADRLVIFSHPENDRDYREDAELGELTERLGVPVTHGIISRS